MRGTRHNIDRREYLSSSARLYAARGEELPQSKLTDADVAKIRRLHDRKQRLVAKLNKRCSVEALAQMFGVHRRTIEKALSQESWAHVRAA
ncbi:hypothetical protein [Chromobacterium violaceum]|uniref:Uncharacterized protein n=1 Tax=Chromobacterium violaceum TaxID=536 RepID=A0A202B2I6_CHRVL|nr:hypothetical protein [Chromobacterium violaceum]OVE45610.1 hypothetical protein CBW21_22500 [Chromobacterium violaceum]